jgi:hypothetical protein
VSVHVVALTDLARWLARWAGSLCLPCTQAGAHPALASLLALDVDPSALRRAGAALAADVPQLRVTLVRANYADIARVAAAVAGGGGGGEQHAEYDGILMDLGCSSMQLDEPERGFRCAKFRAKRLRNGWGFKILWLKRCHVASEWLTRVGRSLICVQFSA